MGQKKVFIFQEKILNATLSLNMGQIFTVWCIARYVSLSKNGRQDEWYCAYEAWPSIQQSRTSVARGDCVQL